MPIETGPLQGPGHQLADGFLEDWVFNGTAKMRKF